jgi:uncharacterized protein YndB with AHSA1/START domain
MTAPTWNFDPKLDLVFERTVDVPRELVWKVWTEPEHLSKWFCPAPWSVAKCVIDLRPGGRFHTTMRSPEGEEFPNEGCYLDVVPVERLVWTDALARGYRPNTPGNANCAVPGFFTAIITFEREGAGTRYKALCLHRDEAGRKQHEEMGFYDGWGAAFEQMVTLVKSLRG